MGEVKVFGYWVSPYSKRVEIALKIKGVDKYEYVEEDLQNKSEGLIQYNPVHKKIPVLLHDGKPVAESLVILEYIEEIWKDNPILPSDPYDRAQARFWAKFIDDKFIPAVGSALMSEGKESEKLKEEAEGVLKILEKEIQGKKFFGGNKVGFLDIVAIVAAHWMPTLQEACGKELITNEKFPGFCGWADRLLACSAIKENVPPREKLLQFYRAHITSLRVST